MNFIYYASFAKETARLNEIIAILTFTQSFPFWKQLVVVNGSTRFSAKFALLAGVSKVCFTI